VVQVSYCGSPAVSFPYLDADGTAALTRYRVSMDGDRFRWKRGSKAKGALFGRSRLGDARERDYLLLVEGEADALTAWFHDYPAAAIPGAGMWDETRNAGDLDGIGTVYVLVEPDAGGEVVLDWLQASAIRERVRLVRLPDVKDVSALHLDNPDRFGERLEAALQSATPWAEHARIRDDLRRAAEWQEAEPLARDPRLLDRFAEALPGVGLVGEERAARLLYLALTSRLLDRPTSVVVKGPSAGGKSHTVGAVLRFFPSEAYVERTGLSEHALAYSTEPLRHRHLVIYEAAALAGDFVAYLLRTLLSEGRLVYETVERTPEGSLEARTIEREGPTAVVLTTTRLAVDAETETRLLSLTVSDRPEQTAAVFAALADEDGRPDPNLAPWLALQGWLATGETRVTLPFAHFLAQLVPPVAVRLRRDFGVLLNLCRAHALLHQERRERDELGRIVATVEEDYATVRALVADLLAEGVERTVPEDVRETVEAVARLDAAKGEGVSVAALAQALDLDKASASRRWNAARRRGYLRNLEERRGRPARLVADEPLPDDVELLPPVDLLADCCARARVPRGGNGPPSP
jgi:hypothetical protein